jgi:hypothetical protein
MEKQSSLEKVNLFEKLIDYTQKMKNLQNVNQSKANDISKELVN